MNLTTADSIFINGKEVQQISIDGNIVYTAGYRIRLSADKSFILPDETVNISVNCEDLHYTQIELYKVINMTRSLVDTLTTDGEGKATYTYTGVGAGEIGFVAVYDNTESNTVQIDDYTPYADEIILSASASSIGYGQSVLLTATVKDQHGELIQSGTVTFKENGVTIGTGSVTSGVATLTVSNFNEGTHSIIAEIGNVTSNTANVNVLSVSLSLGVTGSSFSTGSNTPFVYTGNVFVDWGDSTIEEYIDGALTHTYSVSDDYTVKIYGDITELAQQCFEGCDITDADIGSPITTLGGYCFSYCDSLSNVILSDSVTSIGTYCFAQCAFTSISIPSSVTIIEGPVFESNTSLTEVVLNWESSSDIVEYQSYWTRNCSSFDHFLIPAGTTALYEAKGYPSNLLVEQTPFDGIDLTSDKSILSAADSEYATLTAQLTNGGSPVSVSGETVSFEVRKESDDSLVETLTDDTNSSGIATVSYYGKGVGDIYIKAECNLLIQTYSIEDCPYYGAMTSNDGHWTYPSASVSYSSQGCKITGTNWADAPCNVTFTKPVSIKWTYTTSPTDTFYIAVKDNGSNIFTGQISSSKVIMDTPSSQTFNGKGGTGDYEFKFKNDGTVEFYKNDVYVGSTTYTGTPQTFNWGYGGNRNVTFKDFKIKPL